jgi:hypothetical protein
VKSAGSYRAKLPKPGLADLALHLAQVRGTITDAESLHLVTELSLQAANKFFSPKILPLRAIAENILCGNFYSP